MKTCKFLLFIIFLTGLLGAEQVYGAPPKKLPKYNSKTSCSITRTKFTVSDQVEYFFGVVAGQNISTIKTKGSESMQDVITGIAGGVGAQIVWPKGFTIQPEILYSQKGCKFTGAGASYYVNYLEIPAKFMYRLQITDIKPFAFAAPYAAYALNLKQRGDFISDDSLSPEINKLDYGVGVGAGFDAWFIQVSFRYSWGFAQVLNESFSVRNNVFTISAGVFF